jgi:DUF1365 family protein
MKKDIINRIILSILLLFSGYLIGLVSSDCSSASHHEVEYRIIGLNHLSETSELEDELNKMGVDGWELVQFGKYMAIFKR